MIALQSSSSFLPPLLIPTCTLIAGIALMAGCLHDASTFPIALAMSLALGMCAFFIAWRAPKHIALIALAAIFYGVGIGRMYSCQRAASHSPLSTYNKPVTLQGTVTNISTNYDSRMRQCTTLAVHSVVPIDNTTQKETIDQTVQIYSSSLPDIDVGDTIEMRAVTFKEIDNLDFKKYLDKEGVATTLFIQKPEYRVINRPAWSPSRAIFHQKMRIFMALRKKISRKTFTLFATLFLGERTYNKQYITSLSGKFQYWGLMHYLARSGLHMVIFAATWEFLFRLLPIPFLVRQLILLLFYILYFILSWPSIPFIRAFMTVMLYKTCVFSSRPSHFFAALPTICCAVLLYNPLQLFFLDFQLSFLLTFALGWFNYTTRNNH